MNTVELLKKITKKYSLKDEISNPILSPDEDKLLLINPYGWETQSNIYFYDLLSDKLNLLHEWQYDLACKFCIWEDNNNILCILGNTYGTVNIGGDIYRIDINSRKKELVVEFSENVQIESFEFIDESNIRLLGIEYLDDNFIESKDLDYNLSI